MNFWQWLALLFIGLKLLGALDWSWLWVLAPLWGPWLFGLALGLSAYAVASAILAVIVIKERLDLARYRWRRGA